MTIINDNLTDDSILKELGERLTGARIRQNLTQAALAEQAGVSKRTIERLESGAVATQLSSFLRVCRTLGLLQGVDHLIPPAAESPMLQLKQAGKKRQRATGKKAQVSDPKQWTWSDES